MPAKPPALLDQTFAEAELAVTGPLTLACSAIRAALRVLDGWGEDATRLAEARRILHPYAALDARQPRPAEPTREAS